MKKQILTLVVCVVSAFSYAQVGVGTTNPLVSLQVDKSAVATDADGVLVPRVTVAELNTKEAAYVATLDGNLVFVTNITGATGKTVDVTSTGFYYYDAPNSKWKAVGGGAAPVYQDIVGGVQTVTSGSYTVAATDYAVVTNHTAGVTITFPDLNLADAGRTVFVFNNNTGSFNNALVGTITGIQTNTLGRGMEFLWTGTFWAIIGK